MLLTSWLCGWSGRARSPLNDWPRHRRRLRPHEMRRWMAPAIEPLEIRLVPTTISLTGPGDLLIESFGSVSDLLNIHADGASSRFVVSDPGQTLFTSISGATGSGSNIVLIPFSSVPNAKQLIVSTFDGDDVIRLTAAGTDFFLSPTIDAGTGSNDLIESLAVVSVATVNLDVVLNAENIRLGANISTAGGKVSLFGNVMITNNVGITTDGASDGDVLITGPVDSGAGPSLYTLISTPRRYDEARMQASFDVPGGHLVTIRSALEQTDVQAAAGTNDVWIGASDVLGEGDWIWDAGPDNGVQFWSGDGTTGGSVGGEFSNWQSGEPDNLDGTNEGDAAFLSGSDPAGRWSDGDINVPRAYVVESPTLFSLSINAATAMVNLNGSVGSVLPLRSFSVTAGQTQLIGGAIITSKSQTFDTDLSLPGPTLLCGEEVNFNGGAGSVTGSGTSMLTLAPIKRDAAINIGATSETPGDASFDITDLDIAALGVGFTAILIGEPPPPLGSGGGLGSLPPGSGSGAGFPVPSIGPVTITSATFSNFVSIAGGSISVSGLDAGTNRVELVAGNGSITDGGGTGPDIRAGNLLLDSSSGIGVLNDALETSASAVSARASNSGGVFLDNTGNLAIGAAGAPGGIFTNNGEISVSTTGAMPVNQSIVSNGGNINLTATNGISINGVPVNTARIDGTGGQFTADADSNNDGSGTFSITSITEFVDWTSATTGTLAGETISISPSSTLATATAQSGAADNRFQASVPVVYSPPQDTGEFVETSFSQPGEFVRFDFSRPLFGLFLHFDGMQVQDPLFDPLTGNPINLYAFDRFTSKVSGDASWMVDTSLGTNSIRQLNGNHLGDQDGTVRFDEEINSLTMSRTAPGVSLGAESTVNLQLGRFLAGGILSNESAVTIRAADFDLNGFLNAGSGPVSLIPSATNRTIDLGASGGSGQFVVTDAELDQISTTSGILVGNSNSGTITINGAVTRAAATNLSLTTANNRNIRFAGTNAHLDANGGSVSLTTGGSGAIISGDAASDIHGAGVALTSGTGGVGTLSNPLTLNAQTLTSGLAGNANQFFSEVDDVTIEATGLSAGTGTITFLSGTFRLGGSDRISDDSPVVVASDATLQLNGFNESLASLSGSGSVINGSAAAASLTTNFSGNIEFFGTLGGEATLENNFSLTKSGGGSLTLSGTNTYTGATLVGSGKLLVNGSTTSATTVASGATLGGSGTVSNSVTINSGGTVAPGTSPGILNSGDVSLQSGSIFRVELNGTNVGTQYDQLNVTGTVTIGSSVTLDASLGFTPSAGDAFVIIKNDGSDAIVGTFNGLSPGALLTLGSDKLHIYYNHDSGDGNTNDVAVIANRIPVVNNQSFSINEDSGNGATVDTVLATDADSAVTFAITSGDPGNVFAISSGTGLITVNDASGLNFESTPTFTLTVEITDDSGATDTATITIAVTNVAPSVPVDGDAAADSVSEGAVNGDTVGVDADSKDIHGGTVTFSLTNDAGGRFTINGLTGVVTVADASLFDFSVATSHTIIIQASDGRDVATKSITINMGAAAPSTPSDEDDHANTVPEGALEGSRVGITFFADDAQGEEVFYRLTDDAGGRFKIDPLTGVVMVKASRLLSFADATQHTIRVEAVDVGGNVSEVASRDVRVTQVPLEALPLASILPSRVTIVEGDPDDPGHRFISFLVKLNKPSTETVQIDFSTRVGDEPGFLRPDGIPANASLATDIVGSWDFFRSSGRLVFDPGVTEQTMRVQLRPDDLVEENELFFVQLDSPVKARLADGQSIAVAEILDDDSKPQVIVENAEKLEGGLLGTPKELVFRLKLVGDFALGRTSATVDFATDDVPIDTATPNVDYTAVTGRLTFTEDGREQEVRIPITGDLGDEADETLSLRFTNAVGLGLSRNFAVGTIINDDSADVVVSITPSVSKVREGHSGVQQVKLFVTLIGQPTTDVAVNYTTEDHHAIAGSDYVAASGTVTFTLDDIAAGRSEKPIFITVNGDTDVERDEGFAVSLSLPTPLPDVSLDPSNSLARVVLRNDDQAILTEDADDLFADLLADLVRILEAGGGAKDNPALVAEMERRAVQIARSLGLIRAIILIIDPVDFVLTDPGDRQSGYTANTGSVNQVPGTYYSGDGAVELLIVPLPPDGTYNVQLAGLGGDFNASVTIVNGDRTTSGVVSDFSGQFFQNGDVAVQIGEGRIPVGLGLAAAHAGAASAVGVVGAFDQAEFRLALASALEQATSNEFDLDETDSRATGLMFWLSVSARALRQQVIEPLWQSLGTPLGSLLNEGGLTRIEIPSEFVDQFWSQVGQTLTGIPSGIYRLGNMLESVIPILVPRRIRSTLPRSGDQGQPNSAPGSNGTKARRSSLDRPRVAPPNGQAQPPSKPNATKDKSAQTPDSKKVDGQQANTSHTRWLWFTFKDERPTAKPIERRGA